MNIGEKFLVAMSLMLVFLLGMIPGAIIQVMNTEECPSQFDAMVAGIKTCQKIDCPRMAKYSCDEWCLQNYDINDNVSVAIDCMNRCADMNDYMEGFKDE